MRVAKALVYDNEGYALVLRRSGTHPYFAHEADLPGGIIEDGETYEEGIAREIFEETGITVAPTELVYGAERKSLGRTPKRLYEARLSARPTVTLSWEHDAYEWVAPADLAGLLVSRDNYMTFAAAYVRGA